MKSSKALGRGINILLQSKGGPPSDDAQKQEITFVPINSVAVNAAQPRKSFDHERLEELADSIRQHGVLQPVLLEKRADELHLIAGERRLRAAKEAGLSKIPAFIGEYSDVEKREIALVENIQREDLHPLEIAQAIEDLIAVTDWTHGEAAKHLGMSRSKLTNLLRLLGLSEMVQSYLKSGSLSMSHARSMVSLTGAQQSELCSYVVQEQASVRETEELCVLMQKGLDFDDARSLWQRNQQMRAGINPKDIGAVHEEQEQEILKEPALRKSNTNSQRIHSAEERALLDRMVTHFGTKVRLTQEKTGGELRIRFYDQNDLLRITDLLQLPDTDLQE